MTGARLRQAPFAELTGREVYGLCRLRVDVFVVEQQCPYPELDGRDAEPETVHLWFESDGAPVSTVRVLTDGEIVAIWNACNEAPYGTAARLLILTGARLQEITRLRESEIIDEISQQFGVSSQVATQDVCEFLTELEQLGLLSKSSRIRS